MGEDHKMTDLFQNIDFDTDSLCLALINSIGEGLIAVDDNGLIRLVNPIGEFLTGWSRSEMMGKNIAEIFAVQDIDQGIPQRRIPILKVFEEKEAFSVHNRFLLTRKDGTVIPISETATPIVDKKGHLVGAILVFRGISEVLDAEARVEHLATHDFLTGLPNRRLLVDRLDVAISQSRRKFQRVGLLFIDLDNFKRMNDAYGHKFGDEILKKVAQALAGSIRESDTAARIGGDEFAILLNNLQERKDLLPVVSKLAASFEKPMNIGGHEIEICISIGEALYPDDAEEVDALLAHADKMMYLRKQETKRGSKR